jgi:hypothetical protein
MSYSLQAWIAANTALLTLVKAAEGTPTIKIFDADDVELGSATIDEATSAVSEVTGVLTIAIDTQEVDTTAGTASYAQVCDGVGDPHVELPCQEGEAAVEGYCVIDALTITSGQSLSIVSASVGVGSVIGA